MFYYVYKITNQINGKFYIGAHSTKNLDDGYMGSGKRIKYAIEKYGIENFNKEILKFYDTKVEMYLAEKELVELGNHSYNLVEGGGGIDPLNSKMFDNSAHKIDHINKMNAARKEKMDDVFFRKQYSKKMSESIKNSEKANLKLVHKLIKEGKLSPKEYGLFTKGSKHSDSTKKKIKESTTGKINLGNGYSNKPVYDEFGNLFESRRKLAAFYKINEETVRNRIKKGIYKTG